MFNEPLSFLQRMLEYLEYAHLLRMASEQTDPVARMEYIAGEYELSGMHAALEKFKGLGQPIVDCPGLAQRIILEATTNVS